MYHFIINHIIIYHIIIHHITMYHIMYLSYQHLYISWGPIKCVWLDNCSWMLACQVKTICACIYTIIIINSHPLYLLELLSHINIYDYS
jgi:hypothetical protein